MHAHSLSWGSIFLNNIKRTTNYKGKTKQNKTKTVIGGEGSLELNFAKFLYLDDSEFRTDN